MKRCQIPDVLLEVPAPKRSDAELGVREKPYQVLLMSLNEDREVCVFVENRSVMQCTREDLQAFARALVDALRT